MYVADTVNSPPGAEPFTRSPVVICLFGSFRLFKSGSPVLARRRAKTEALLSELALRHGQPSPREALLERVWPGAVGARHR